MTLLIFVPFTADPKPTVVPVRSEIGRYQALAERATILEDAGKKEDLVLFGSASRSNGGGGATSGMSFSW
jgi:hypothetical protein